MQRRTARPFEARMMALSDALFNEFEDLPVLTVMRAITSSWGDLRTTPPTLPVPEAVVGLARARLFELRADASRSRDLVAAG